MSSARKRASVLKAERAVADLKQTLMFTQFERDVNKTALEIAAEHVKGLQDDAERYRWLREQHWSEGPLAVVRDPKNAIKLGHESPSRKQLDDLIDEERRKA